MFKKIFRNFFFFKKNNIPFDKLKTITRAVNNYTVMPNNGKFEIKYEEIVLNIVFEKSTYESGNNFSGFVYFEFDKKRFFYNQEIKISNTSNNLDKILAEIIFDLERKDFSLFNLTGY